MASDPGETGGSSGFDRLDDDDVKLVAYTIVSVRRGHERVLPEGLDSIVVTDNLTAEAFSNSIVTQYFQTPVGMYTPAEDRKYLRVHFSVVRRWPREPLEYEEKSIAALRGIAQGCQRKIARV
jgi:hypothetical protein